MEKKLEYEVLPQREPRRRRRRRRKKKKKYNNNNNENENEDEKREEQNKNKKAKTTGRKSSKSPAVVMMMMNTEDEKRTETGTNATTPPTTTTATCFLSAEKNGKRIVSYNTAAANTNQYEYKDHTADIQIRSWGDSTATAFAWSALGMFDYMTPLHNISETPKVYRNFECSAHDLKSLLFAFLDELLFVFHTESLVCTKIQINEFRENKGEVGEEENRWTIEGIVAGDLFVDGVNEQGTEVKAITYSEMQIHVEENGSTEVYVIVDI
jgi:SHS2 domain-containing protein